MAIGGSAVALGGRVLAAQSLRDGVRGVEVRVEERRAEGERCGQRDERREEEVAMPLHHGSETKRRGAAVSTAADQNSQRAAMLPWCSTRSESSSAS